MSWLAAAAVLLAITARHCKALYTSTSPVVSGGPDEAALKSILKAAGGAALVEFYAPWYGMNSCRAQISIVPWTEWPFVSLKCTQVWSLQVVAA
jgi:hypothetical protein